MPRRSRLSDTGGVLLGLALLMLAATPASAHRLKVFASEIGGNIEGEAYFVGSGPAGGVTVTLRDDAGTVLRSGTTGSDGRFALPSGGDGNLVVVVDAQDGHVARFAIAGSDSTSPGSPPATAEPVATSAGSAATTAEIDLAVARRIAPLAAQIDALESTLRIQDVIGGIGYIAGIFGLIAFLKSRRRAGAP